VLLVEVLGEKRGSKKVPKLQSKKPSIIGGRGKESPVENGSA
jgi:hypothetical protein